MPQPQLTIVTGPNAAGKSSFIRTRIKDLADCEVIMTDVYKNRTVSVFRDALKIQKNIVLETLFNDSLFKDLVNEARERGYHTSLIVLFLDSIQQSIDRVAFRSLEEGGLHISGKNIRINFNENFKNTGRYYYYFDQSDFIYTGIAGKNQLVMRFQKALLTSFNSTDLQYPQKFADYASHDGRLNPGALEIIKANRDYGMK